MLYFANPCGPAVVAAMMDRRIGFIDTPAQGNTRPEGVMWCADNGCFSDRWDEGKWWQFLERNAFAAGSCSFAVAPDVVGDAAATAVKAAPWLPRMRGLGYPVAWVAQDGQEDVAIPWADVDALFIGGSTGFKLGAVARGVAAEAKRRGKWLHMGRVNSLRRFTYARHVGCDSVDGTFVTFGPDINLPRLLGWAASVDQGVLGFEVSQ